MRETRLAALFAHILILLSALWLLPILVNIPRSVLSGLFLYMAFTSLNGNEMFERILLLLTEQVGCRLFSADSSPKKVFWPFAKQSLQNATKLFLS